MIKLDIREVKICPNCGYFHIAKEEWPKRNTTNWPGKVWYCKKRIVDQDYTKIEDERVWDGVFPEWCPLPTKGEK